MVLDDPILGRMIRTWARGRRVAVLRRGNYREKGGEWAGKVEGSPVSRFLGSGARRSDRRLQIDGDPKLRAAPMVNGRRSFDCRRLSRGGAWPRVGEDGGAHQKPILGVDLGGEGPEKQIDAKGVELGRRSHGGRRWRADSGRGKLERGLGWCGGGGGAHQEPILGVDLGGEGPKKRIDAKGWSSGDAPMTAGDGGPILAGKARARPGEVQGRWRTR